jgi:hypothetical protein
MGPSRRYDGTKHWQGLAGLESETPSTIALSRPARHFLNLAAMNALFEEPVKRCP